MQAVCSLQITLLTTETSRKSAQEGRKWDCTCVLALKPCDVLHVKNAMVETVCHVTEHTMCILALFMKCCSGNDSSSGKCLQYLGVAAAAVTVIVTVSVPSVLSPRTDTQFISVSQPGRPTLCRVQYCHVISPICDWCLSAFRNQFSIIQKLISFVNFLFRSGVCTI